VRSLSSALPFPAYADVLCSPAVWGFSYSYASILVYFESHEPWSSSSLAALTSIGTILLAVMFIVPCVSSLSHSRVGIEAAP